MKKIREIPKSITAPALCSEAVELLTDICFSPVRTSLKQIDKEEFGDMLIFGTPHRINQQQIAEAFFGIIDYLYEPSFVYITGGETESGRIESDDILACIDDRLQRIGREHRSRYANVDFRLERVSHDSLGNVRSAMALGLGAMKTGIIFIAKSFHCGRCKLTLSKFFPEICLQAWPYDAVLEDGMTTISRRGWKFDRQARNKVWAEFIRIELYGSRGDIAYPSDVRQKVRAIRELTK